VWQDGRTCLFVAAENGHLELVDFMIKNKADINKAVKVRKQTLQQL